ncbi:hypothetical protein Afil01_06170 [Actinorhabdospora filicis]|uniref:Uncharacterized protein n=1 Tax=Actinorhabdospora filicis TaxID=1785913 RepID=A0A9W6SGY9_9ACTN|nr:SCO2521 family protein [Actinorhabdospora filicis]GLZ75810.1 hypothetical protein Afil01_06170 [Actinorhabdospora filicis]
MITVGEVHTGLLQHSTAVPMRDIGELLGLMDGARVRHSERPIAHSISPERLVGLDCELPNGQGRARGIGTAATRALLVGRHVLQGSTYARIVRGDADRRLPWSHYIARPGVIEIVGRADPDRLYTGLGDIAKNGGTLDLGSVSGRTIDDVQKNAGLDRRPPFKGPRTRLRWVARTGSEPGLVFRIDGETTRTAQFITTRDADVSTLAALSEDIAVHDWLLTTAIRHVERALIGSAGRADVVSTLRPVIDHMLHLWMPAARLDDTMADLWAGLEKRPGFSRQWKTLIARIRDQMTLATIDASRGRLGEY